MKRVAIYGRSSPDCPISADEQIEHLRKVASERGWTVAHVFSDRPISVKKGQDRRLGQIGTDQLNSIWHDRQSADLVYRPSWEMSRRSNRIYRDMPFCPRCY